MDVRANFRLKRSAIFPLTLRFKARKVLHPRANLLS